MCVCVCCEKVRQCQGGQGKLNLCSLVFMTDATEINTIEALDVQARRVSVSKLGLILFGVFFSKNEKAWCQDTRHRTVDLGFPYFVSKLEPPSGCWQAERCFSEWQAERCFSEQNYSADGNRQRFRCLRINGRGDSVSLIEDPHEQCSSDTQWSTWQVGLNFPCFC